MNRMKYCIISLLLSIPVWALIAQENPVTVEEVAFTSGSALLKGKLIMPMSDRKLPVVIFCVGSGPSASYATNYTSFLKYFFEDSLLNQNIGLFYFDKRGVGASSGKWHTTSLEERANDAKEAAVHISKLENVDPRQIYIAGHSQGGWVVQIALAKYPDIFAGGISMAGATFGVKRQIQNDYLSEYKCDGMSPEKALKKSERKTNFNLGLISMYHVGENLQQLQLIKDFEPQEYLIKINKPLLFLFGENDGLVNPEWCNQELKTLFGETYPSNFKTITVSNVNHSFKIADACYQGKYSDIAYSEATKEIISQWMNEVAN